MRVPEGGAHAVLHVITEGEGVAVSTSSSSGSRSDELWASARAGPSVSSLTLAAGAAALGWQLLVHGCCGQLLLLLLRTHRAPDSRPSRTTG